MGNLGTPEILIIGLVILVLFGAKRIPEFMQGLGKGVREFRKAARDIQEEIEKPIDQKILIDRSEQDIVLYQ